MCPAPWEEYSNKKTITTVSLTKFPHDYLSYNQRNPGLEGLSKVFHSVFSWGVGRPRKQIYLELYNWDKSWLFLNVLENI